MPSWLYFELVAFLRSSKIVRTVVPFSQSVGKLNSYRLDL